MNKFAILVLWIYILYSIVLSNQDTLLVESTISNKSELSNQTSINANDNTNEGKVLRDSSGTQGVDQTKNETKSKVKPKHLWLGFGIFCAVVGVGTLVVMGAVYLVNYSNNHEWLF